MDQSRSTRELVLRLLGSSLRRVDSAAAANVSNNRLQPGPTDPSKYFEPNVNTMLINLPNNSTC